MSANPGPEILRNRAHMSRFSISLLARLVLGGVFLYAGFVKLGQPLEFAGNIAAYELLPYFGNILLAATLPWIECICGLLLITGWKLRPAAALATALMVVFVVALISAQARGITADCGCFEVGKSDVPPPLWIAALRDMGLLILSTSVWLSSGRK